MFCYCSNSPIVYIDVNGQEREYMRATLGGYGGGAGAGIIAGLVTAAAVAVQGVAYAVKQATKSVVKAVSKTVQRATEKKHVVYHLVDKNNNNNVEYVGRTCHVSKRKNAHENNESRSHLTMVVVASNLNYAEARALEQISMMYHHTINTANAMNNQINGISPKSDFWGSIVALGMGTLKYVENKITNEILWWAGS